MPTKIPLARCHAAVPRDDESSAHRVLDAHSAAEALSAATRVLDMAPRCGCCISHRVHLARYVGSTFFVDDEPQKLARALPPRERTPWTERVIAACIVLYGRARETWS